jgi:antitoxin (DNA-binding transcriptional repressor) of toxin-antitoxin stability system
MYMKSVGIKVLKDNLSKYLKLVRGGETILVTDRDEVIAEIRQPAPRLPGSGSRLAAFLDEEARRGSVVRAKPGATSAFARLRDMPRPRVPIDLQSLLDETRAD